MSIRFLPPREQNPVAEQTVHSTQKEYSTRHANNPTCCYSLSFNRMTRPEGTSGQDGLYSAMISCYIEVGPKESQIQGVTAIFFESTFKVL